MKRTPSVGKSSNRRKIPKNVREEVRRRSGGRCEAVHPGCTGTARHMHHVRMRSQGGEDVASNLLDLCFNGHHYIHHHTGWAYQNGYLERTSVA